LIWVSLVSVCDADHRLSVSLNTGWFLAISHG
jgi:hypothetical protein